MCRTMSLGRGYSLESRFIVTRRNRTIHKRMREYLYVLTHHEELTTAVLPVGDGITRQYKKERKAVGGTTDGLGAAAAPLLR